MTYTVDVVDSRTGETLVRVTGMPRLPDPGDVVAGFVVVAGPRTFGTDAAVVYTGVVRIPGRAVPSGVTEVRAQVATLLPAWVAAFGDARVTLQTVLAHVDVAATLQAAQIRVSTRALGASLSAFTGVSVAGLVLERSTSRWGNRAVWRVVRDTG